MFSNLKLGKKFNLLLLLVFLGGILLTGTAFAGILANNARDQVTTKALLLMQAMNSVREYTSTQVNPELQDRLEVEPEFIPQSIPSYSVREVFEILRKDPSYNQFFYKEATLNPTNLRDKADTFEAKIVEQFRSQTNLKELTGFRPSPGGDLFYIARPLAVTKESCLVCHSTPDAAPKSLVATYGSENGFGWKLNEIVSAQVMSVPASEVVNSAYGSFFFLMMIAIGVFAIAIFLINILLNRAVIRPLNRMAAIADQISTGEIGTLAAAFNRMKLSLVMAMKMLYRPTTQE
jgi:HAMP domain-containing protein